MTQVKREGKINEEGITYRFKESEVKDILTPNKTSAKFLVEYARLKFLDKSENKKEYNLDRFVIIYDIFIKARSYAILNKIFFWLSVFFGIMVLLWPSLAIFAKDFGFNKEFLKSAIVQTTITGLAVLCFAAYSHYKKGQMRAENLIRYAIFSEENIITIKDNVMSEMERVDSGFNFSKGILKEEGAKNE